MKIIPIITALAAGGGTYYAVRNTPIPLPGKIAASAVGAGVGYYAGTKISNLVMPGSSQQIVGGAKTELQQILQKNLTLPPDQRQLPTVTPAQMKIYANNLYTAMDGGGTNFDDGIKPVMEKMNSDVDILNLIAAFGTRHGSSWFASSDDTDLATWFADDGATADVNEILETKPMISYRF